jgi:long-subunit acyl-CoA synthetase (AMP-forming)
VLAALRAAVGMDALNWSMSGAAPIAQEVLEFFFALGVPVCELWGMSEMLGGTINPPGRQKLGTVGVAVPGTELRIAEDGELLVRSPWLMSGYRSEPGKTAEAIDADGWLHTGDIAEIDDLGYVKIVDRKKELMINAGGKNMSPTNIENAIKGACPLIAQVIAIGDRRPYNVALITLEPDALDGRSVDDEEIVEAVRRGVEEGNARLARVEQIKRFKLLADEWLPGGDEITPTMKLKRKPITEKYAHEIEALYAG